MNQASFSDESNADRNGGLETATYFGPSSGRGARLPPELTDMIINELSADRVTLAICALVCRSWVPASRRHLFLRFEITPASLSDASEILSSAICTIASAVQHLALMEIQCPDDLHEIICRLSNVTEFSICAAIASDMRIFSSPAWASFLQNVRSLWLVAVDIDSLDTFCLLLSHPLRLRSLVCKHMTIFTPIKGPILQTNHDVLMPDVRVSDELSHCILARMPAGMPQLTSLTLESSSAYFDRGALVESLFQTVGSRLQEFRLSLDPHDTCEYFSDGGFVFLVPGMIDLPFAPIQHG
jgi:hypothetical protein